MKKFLIYMTANEKNYITDFRNFKRIASHNAGCSNVFLILVVSEVKTKSTYDEKITKALCSIAMKNPQLCGCSVIFKPNKGRDFSSALCAMNFIVKFVGQQDAHCLFVNRSAIGPLKDNWFAEFLEQLELTGSRIAGITVNQSGLNGAKVTCNNLHVQTYAYMCKKSFFQTLLDKFPGVDRETKEDLIVYGEIELSRMALQNGGKISCLAWPNITFPSEDQQGNWIPKDDIKREVKNLPYLHRTNIWLKRSVSDYMSLFNFLVWKSLVFLFGK